MKRIPFQVGVLATAFVFVFTLYLPAQRPLLGGYKPAKTTDAAVKAAAEFAVTTQAEKEENGVELVSIIKAERPTVAGTNYRLCLKVNSAGGDNEADVVIFVQAIVNVNLKKESRLTSWTVSDCGDEEE